MFKGEQFEGFVVGVGLDELSRDVDPVSRLSLTIKIWFEYKAEVGLGDVTIQLRDLRQTIEPEPFLKSHWSLDKSRYLKLSGARASLT